MVEQGTRDDEIVATLFDWISKNIDSADLETRYLRVHDTTEIDVACNYVTSGRYALSQSPRNRPVVTADFQTAPARMHPQPGNVSAFDRIQQR
jgi:hypothetical protein